MKCIPSHTVCLYTVTYPKLHLATKFDQNSHFNMDEVGEILHGFLIESSSFLRFMKDLTGGAVLKFLNTFLH